MSKDNGHGEMKATQLNPVQQGQPTIHGFMMSVTVKCGCGEHNPVQVAFIAGMELKTTCGACKGQLFLAGVFYDMNKPGEMGVAVAYEPPLISIPKLELVGKQ